MDPDTDRTEIRAEATIPWQRPAVEVVNLACELSAYAPDDGGPLF